MPRIERLGEMELVKENDMHKIPVVNETRKYAIPLEIDIYGDILIHQFWPCGMFTTIEPRYIHEQFDLHRLHFNTDDYTPINIECKPTLETCLLAFGLEMTDDEATLFNDILRNIARFTKTSHYPAIGIIEVPVGVGYVDVTDVAGCKMLLNGTVRLTNIICGFDNDETFWKNFLFTGYNQENVEKLPQVFKFEGLNHHMY